MTSLAYGREVIAGMEGYASASALAEQWKANRVARLWRLGARIISLQLDKALGGGIWKSTERLALDTPTYQLNALESAGVNHPSSWADTFHQLAPIQPRVKHTFNGLLDWWSGGPWSEAIKTGTFTGQWYRYDLISAYRWASSLGLPVIETYRVTRENKRHGRLKPGIWVARIKNPTANLPTAFRTTKPVVVTSEDIEAYKIDVEVERGICWTETHPSSYVETTLQKLPYPKEAGRAYWGRWIARDPLIVQTRNKEWQMNNVFANFIWGWLIVHRVRQRVWQAASNAVHVYVDEVLTSEELPTGKAVGDWHLKQSYPNGVFVRRTGWYGAIGENSTMKTG